MMRNPHRPAYFVDHTDLIRELERTANYVIFLRPRRFGKSLLCAILQAYYDIDYADKFEEFFGELKIGQNPTAEHNQYLVLTLDFAAIDKEYSKTQGSFDQHCSVRIDEFARRHRKQFPEGLTERILSEPNSGAKLNAIMAALKGTDIKLYLIIDEYDNFTNTILAESRERYEALCHGDGFFKQFFTVLKAATTGTDAPISRIFITGVSPVTMDDVTSGFNIAANISMNPAFSSLAGFTQDDLKAMLEYYHEHADFKFDPEKVRADISEWYDNYRFATVPMADGSAVPSVANSTLVLSFMRYFLQNHQYPPEFIDENLRVDYRKIRHIITESHKINGNFHRLEEILEKKGCTATLARSFQARDITRDDNFVTLLYYFGLLTICGSRFGRTILKIPNRTIEEFMHDFVPRAYEDVNNIDFHGDELLICEEC